MQKDRDDGDPHRRTWVQAVEGLALLAVLTLLAILLGSAFYFSFVAP